MSTPVFILGGGPSLREVNFSFFEGKTVIASNRAFFYLKTPPQFFVTTDYSFLLAHCTDDEKARLRKSSSTKVFCVSADYPYLKNRCGVFYDVRVGQLYDLSFFDVVVHGTWEKGLGLSFRNFHTGCNSGFSAFQFAVVMGFNPIYLFGIDLTIRGSKTHFHTDYNKQPSSFLEKLAFYLEFWKVGLKKAKEYGLEVYSCSPFSSLNEQIPYIPYVKID